MDIGRKNSGHFLKSIQHRGRRVASNKPAKNIKRVVQIQVLREATESRWRSDMFRYKLYKRVALIQNIVDEGLDHGRRDTLHSG